MNHRRLGHDAFRDVFDFYETFTAVLCFHECMASRKFTVFVGYEG